MQWISVKITLPNATNNKDNFEGNFEGNFQNIENICDLRNRKIQSKNDNNLIDNSRIIIILKVLCPILFVFFLFTNFLKVIKVKKLFDLCYDSALFNPQCLLLNKLYLLLLHFLW